MENYWNAEAGAVSFTAYMQKKSYLRHDQVAIGLEYLLTDLMHFADAQGVDFEDCLDMARLRHDDDTGNYRGA